MEQDLTPRQKAARQAVATRKARAAQVAQAESESHTNCQLCGKPTRVNGRGLPTYHAACAEACGIAHGPQVEWGLM